MKSKPKRRKAARKACKGGCGQTYRLLRNGYCVGCSPSDNPTEDEIEAAVAPMRQQKLEALIERISHEAKAPRMPRVHKVTLDTSDFEKGD